MDKPPYRGRFAPSPTGPLHFGSLVAAAASWLDARASGGEWLVRIEDVDAPRTVPGAADAILRALDLLGLHWDGEPAWQSRRIERYRQAHQRLIREGWVFGCRCTRREIADSAMVSDGSRRYPGTCRAGLPPGESPRAFRVRVEPGELSFEDRVQGRVSQNLAAEVGDFVVLRADGCFAYQLAVVVDDFEQGITDIVRGADLIDSTPRQLHLQRLLGAPTPRYLHVPVALGRGAEKLSKQTRAAPIEAMDPAEALTAALEFLGLKLPADLRGAPPRELLRWARPAWSPSLVPRLRALPAPDAVIRPRRSGIGQ